MNETVTSFEELFAIAEKQPEYWQQHAMLDFAEETCRIMDEKGISRAELARRIGKSPAYVTQILRGDTNFTIGTMVRLAQALGCRLRLHLAPTPSISVWFDEIYWPRQVTEPSDYEPSCPATAPTEGPHEGTSVAAAA